MPMVTLVKTLDITRLVRYSRRQHTSLNMLLCWCIGKAANGFAEFFVIPEQGKLYRYDALAISVIVQNVKGGINSCDIAFSENLHQFAADYHRQTQQASTGCEDVSLENHMVIGTSNMIQTELDCVVNQYTDLFCNPMLMWGKYRRHWFKSRLPISFQFHHVQMDGSHAAAFLDSLQQVIRGF